MSNDSYQLIDSGNFQKLEQVGPYRFVRPAAQAVWRPRLSAQEWKRVDATFTRFSGGDGKWQVLNPNMPATWQIKSGPVAFQIKMTDFGHLGIFPEQDTNWLRLHKLVKHQIQKQANENPGKTPEFSVLNLFAYTGGSTLACATAGAKVVHVDASKTSVAWARNNAEISGHSALPIRWIIEDVKKFVGREVKRGSKYHGIILDPPSYGRGPSGEAWQIETDLFDHLTNLKQILADDFSFILLSAHSTGYTPMALTNLVESVADLKTGTVIAEEMVIKEVESSRLLPSGACCFFSRN